MNWLKTGWSSKTWIFVLGLLAMATPSCADNPKAGCSEECWNADNCQPGLICMPMADNYMCMPSGCLNCTSAAPVCLVTNTSSCSFISCAK
jgi:hypothetical protein